MSEQVRRTPLHHRIRLALSPSIFPEAGVGLGNKLDLAELMRDIRMCNAFLPKDKIYALHAVLLRQGIELPPPEYNDSVSAGEVYRIATVTMLKHLAPSPSLDLLQLVTGRENRLIGSAQLHLGFRTTAILAPRGLCSMTKTLQQETQNHHTTSHQMVSVSPRSELW